MGYGMAHPSMSTMASMNSMGSVNGSSSNQSVNGLAKEKGQGSSAKKKKSGQKKKPNGETDFRMKYKTEVCKYWAEYGYCQFGD